MAEDISGILQEWPFDPQNSIRKVIDPGGVERIQVRVDQGAFQGILQMNLDGRPDGRRPHDQEFVLDHHKDRLERHTEAGGAGEGFRLTQAECAELFDESRRVYERYVFLLQVQDYDRVIRDTERNMSVFRFVNRHGEREEDREHLERWWPYILRIHAVARVMIAMQNDDFDAALGIIAECRGKIEALREVDAEEFGVERRRSLEALEELRQDLSSKRPMSLSEKLRKELSEAIEKEEFERAARLRDRIRELEQQEGQGKSHLST